MLEVQMVAEINNTISVVNKKWSRNIPLVPERAHEFRSLVDVLYQTTTYLLRNNASEWQVNKLQRIVNGIYAN